MSKDALGISQERNSVRNGNSPKNRQYRIAEAPHRETVLGGNDDKSPGQL